MELTKVVGMGCPFHCKVEPLAKPDPLMVSVNAGPPEVALGGFKVVIEETCELIVNVAALEMAPVEVSTVTLAAPIEAIKLAGTAALN